MNTAFTLIELLVVIALIGILTTLTTLSIGSLGQGNRLTTAGNLAGDLVNNTRQLAQSGNTMAMLVVVEDGADAGRVFAIFTYTAGIGSGGTWSQTDKWRLLPTGVQVDLAASDDFFQAIPASALPIQRNGSNVNCLGAVFLPDGRPFHSSSAPQVLYLKNAYGPAVESNFYKIIVNQGTGIPIVRRP